MNAKDRTGITRHIWTALVIGMIVCSMVLAPFLDEAVIGVIFLMLVGGVITTGFIWNWGQLPMSFEDAQEQARQQRIEQALKKLSDDQLERLRDRMASGAIDEDTLAALLNEESKPKRRG